MNLVGVAVLCVISAGIGWFFGLMQGALKVRVHYDALQHKYELLRSEHQDLVNTIGNLYHKIVDPYIDKEDAS